MTDIRKTFGPLTDRRTGDHMENSSFTGPPKLLQDLILFFQHKSPHRGAPHRNFLPDRRTSTIRVFMGPPLFSLVEEWGPVDFPMSVMGHHLLRQNPIKYPGGKLCSYQVEHQLGLVPAPFMVPGVWCQHCQGSTLIFKVTCPFGHVRFEIHLSCMRCHLTTSPNPCRNMGIVQFCATIFDFSPVPSDKWHCKTTCPRSHFQHFYLSWTVGQPLRLSPDCTQGHNCRLIKSFKIN